MQLGRRLRLAMTIGVAASALSIGLIAPTVSGASAPSGTIVWADGPGASANYIFPYMSCTYFNVNNINQFQFMMFRPLYWFGLPGTAGISYPLSPAKAPVFTNGNKTATITMKGWKFADGQTVNAQSVMFFLNMYAADPGGYCGNNGSLSIPALIKSASGHGNTVKINFTKSLNPGYALYNNLSMLVPMPKAWDTTGGGVAGKCSTGVYGATSTNVACKNVEAYLNAQSANFATYTGKLWQSGVDGPWRLTHFDSLGNATFQPNNRYSGPVKAKVAFVKQVAYTAATAEENDLQAGKVTLGYVDASVLTSPAKAPGVAGPNWAPLVSRYNLLSGSSWAFNYAPLNFNPSDPKAALIKQLYVRQALQLGIDQTGIINNIFKGYGFVTSSPLPPFAPASISAPVNNPYPFDLAKAKALLTSHGWTIQNNVQTCTSPGAGANQCGAGIAQGATLSFGVIWSSGSPSFDQQWATQIADWASIGIQFTHSTGRFNTIAAGCASATSGYEMCQFGGWVYAPDYYPSGESLFSSQGGFNVGTYSDPQMETLIKDTIFGTAKLTAFENFAAQQLPVLFEPNSAGLAEVLKTLKSTNGFKADPLLNFMPEYYHY